ncbi:MAG: hypothetical protein ABSF45_26400 [Terriglobia bacterium]
MKESTSISLETMAHIVEDLFRRPVSELMGHVTNSLNRLSPPLTKSSFLDRSIAFFRDRTDGTPDKITPGSLPPVSFSIRQTQCLPVKRNIDSDHDVRLRIHTGVYHEEQ